MPITQAVSTAGYGPGFQPLSDAVGWPDVNRRQVFDAVQMTKLSALLS